jgi:hypothetical protein
MAATVMMIAGLTIPALADGFTNPGTIYKPASGTYYGHGPNFGPAPHEGPPMYQDTEVSFPGVDGVGIKRFGFRGRLIEARLCFVGESKLIVWGQKSILDNAVTPLASFAVQTPSGPSRPACRLVVGSGTSGQWEYLGGTMVLVVEYQFRQARLY